LSFAPKSYFGAQQLGQYLLSKVKGAIVREKLKALFREGRRFELAQLLGENGISKDDLKRLESLHPAFMGGNYLPDLEAGEIEIARIELNSTTHDVVAAYAKSHNGKIGYRVVDEYGGDTLDGESETSSNAPCHLASWQTSFFLPGRW
jgi:hypothetical protein